MNSRDRALEAYLVAAAKTGDRGALDQLARLRGPRLLVHAVRLLGDRDGARDVVQDAWVEILRGLPRLRDDGAFLPWALRIVTRRVARDIKRRQRGRALAEGLARDGETVTPEGGPIAADGTKLRAAIAGLPPAQAATIALFYLEDMTVAEVAMALDVPLGTVKTRLMHGRNALAAVLKGDSDG